MNSGSGTLLKKLRGAMVTCNYPYSDQLQSKGRPVFIIAEWGDDFIACRTSAQPIGRYDKYSILIDSDDFEWGGLSQQSKIIPYSITTLSKDIIDHVCGVLKKEKLDEIISQIKKIINGKQCLD